MHLDLDEARCLQGLFSERYMHMRQNEELARIHAKTVSENQALRESLKGGKTSKAANKESPPGTVPHNKFLHSKGAKKACCCALLVGCRLAGTMFTRWGAEEKLG